MWFVATKKELKKSFNKVKKQIAELTSQSLNNRVLIEKNKKDISDLKETIKVREVVREPSPRTSSRTK